MRNSKVKTKRNLAIPGEPMPLEEFKALIKEAEEGSFHPIGTYSDFMTRIMAQWKKKYGK